jgi:homoserine O-acetyltransferase/O-succinyltransferase
MTSELFHHDLKFPLESGEYLPGFQLKYSTAGTLNKERSNVIWVTHALTGSSDVLDWWGGLFKPTGAFPLDQYFVICANALGGCYGSTGPLSINRETGKTFYHTFPTLTNRDIVNALDLLRKHLEIEKIHTLIGGSLGGQQVLEWALLKQDVAEHIVPIACNAQHSPWGIAFNEAQRMAIAADATWKDDSARAGVEGMKAARAVAMISYRTYAIYGSTQSEKNNDVIDNFRASTYQRYQGDKLAHRFNAFTYWTFSKAMDSHNVSRTRESQTQWSVSAQATGVTVEVLKQIKAKTLVVGIESDVLFPLSEQRFLAESIPHAEFAVLQSDYGHDGFLVEFDQLNDTLKGFYQKTHQPLQSGKSSKTKNILTSVF